VGNGASSCDILKYFDADPSTNLIKTEVKVLYRSDKYYIPTTINGISGCIILSDTLLKFFEKIPLKLFIFFIILGNIFVFNSYLPTPTSKINSYNIVGSKIIQKLIADGAISYHRETIESVDLETQYVKTDAAIYTDIDLIILATGYEEPIKTPLFKYVVPVETDPTFKIIKNIGFIGFNRAYNFITNAEMRTKWYITNHHLLEEYDVKKWIAHMKVRKNKNNLTFLDATYELFELA
jgi:hypothetical protein